ncbi:hypothetical protein FHS56_001387 [Thermonema lapsum]|uniref:Uncharacterized protein n=1 Tax=Thermonema lapsum TaxID=28195 RepID=A0A846MQL3_9BACT|nr:DUF5522 domain-containing protein [Thermonema lapsum]NIK73874.1 hypothetical protein [Thermonema lapsum]
MAKHKKDTRLQEGVDYYFNEKGLMVLTAHYLRKRGYCCKNGCKHCPYGFKKPTQRKM